MFTWLKDGIFNADFKRDRAEHILMKIDLKNAQWIGVYALLVEQCSQDDIDFLFRYFRVEGTRDSLVMDGLITKIIKYKEKKIK